MRRSALASLSLAVFLFAPSIASADVSRETYVHARGSGIRTTGATPELRARAALSSKSVSGVALAATDTMRFGDGDTIVRFEQTHQGLPVIGRGAAVRLGKNGEALIVAVDVERELPQSIVPAIAASAAARTAATLSKVGADESDAHLVVWPLRGGGARLAWAVVPTVTTGIPTAPRIIVDAVSGKVIEARDMLVFAKAQVYQFNPIKTPNLSLFDLALDPAVDGLTNPFVRSTNCLDNHTVKPVNFGGFKTNVHVCDLVQTAKPDASGNYVYAPSDDPGTDAARSDTFSEVSMYYHASKAYGFFRGLQGDDAAQVVDDKPLPVIANLQIPAGITQGNIALAADPNTKLDPFQNAFFSPAVGGLGQLFEQLYGMKSGALWFGQGPQRDYSYDGDVIYHEFTHAVVDHTIKLGALHLDAHGAIDAPGAMNEGLADYFSSAITGDPDVGEYASKDISPNLTVIRSLANSDKCPTNIIGEVHADSTLFSGALWDARTALGEADRPKFDAALYKALRTNPGRGDLGYDDLAKLFLATLGTDLPAGQAALQASMTARGVLPSCDRVLELGSGGLKALDRSLGGFAAPGLQSIGLTDLAPGILQVHVPFGGKAMATVNVSFTVKDTGGGAGAGILGGGGTPYAPVVLAKFGKAITWTDAGKHDADVKVDATKGTRYTAAIAVPDGATEVFLQIANSGDTDGNYDDVQADLVPADVPPPDDGAQPAAPAPAPSSDSGCACSTPGTAPSSVPVTALGVAAALGLVFAARRRTRRE